MNREVEHSFKKMVLLAERDISKSQALLKARENVARYVEYQAYFFNNITKEELQETLRKQYQIIPRKRIDFDDVERWFK